MTKVTREFAEACFSERNLNTVNVRVLGHWDFPNDGPTRPAAVQVQRGGSQGFARAAGPLLATGLLGLDAGWLAGRQSRIIK